MKDEISDDELRLFCSLCDEHFDLNKEGIADSGDLMFNANPKIKEFHDMLYGYMNRITVSELDILQGRIKSIENEYHMMKRNNKINSILDD